MIICLILAFATWYFVFGIRCWLSDLRCNVFVAPFYHLYLDINFNLPGGSTRCLDYFKKDEFKSFGYPGLSHIISYHVALPLWVLFVFRLVIHTT